MKPKRKRDRVVRGWVTLKGNSVRNFHTDFDSAYEYVQTCDAINDYKVPYFRYTKAELRFKA